MNTKELTVDKWLDHLKQHPLPELIDDECLAALENIRSEYGSTISHGAGLEVRLTEKDRYIDYIMNIDTEEIPLVGSLWYELDYKAFKDIDRENGDQIIPCYFANTYPDANGNYENIWENVLPEMMGEHRTQLLREPLDKVVSALPKGAYIKQIGSMSSRGELDIMRLVIMFPSWEAIPDGLKSIGWQGDAAALKNALLPWYEIGMAAVNIDLGEMGILPKIGFEVASRWRNPILIDKFIDRLEEEDLCIPSKAEALKRWIRIPPQGDPFIQTLIAYFKLNYKDGRITEAKAYLEQSPYLHHHYFDHYEFPIRLDMSLMHGTVTMPEEKAISLISECVTLGIKCIRFYGTTNSELLHHILNHCRKIQLLTEIVVSDLNEISGFENENILFRWELKKGNAKDLDELAKQAKRKNVKEFIISGMLPGSGENHPDKEDFLKAASFIDMWAQSEISGKTGMKLSVDSCFSPLRAFLGGSDLKRNPNRGIERGCMAGRSFMSVRSDGSFTPCLMMPDSSTSENMADYWKKQVSCLHETYIDSCKNCGYKKRCRPCHANTETVKDCPFAI